MIEQIDHILAVVDDIDATRQLLINAKCPYLWDGLYKTVWITGFSIGPVNLELISKEGLAFLGVPTFGISMVSFDPGDIRTTLKELQRAGFDPDDTVNQMEWHSTVDHAQRIYRWNSAAVTATGSLPGLPCFLCEYLGSQQHYGRVEPTSPLRFVELHVALPNLRQAVPIYERALNVRARSVSDGYQLPLANTPIKLIEGNGIVLVVEPATADLPLKQLAAAIPGLHWRTSDATHPA